MVDTPVSLFNITLSNQLGNIVLPDTIGTLADLVGKSTQIAVNERTLVIALDIDVVRLPVREVREDKLRTGREPRITEYHLGYLVKLV